MKTAFFLTCYHHVEELSLYVHFFLKSPEIVSTCDMIVYCNNPEISQDQICLALQDFPQDRLKVIRSTQNCGWQFGSFEGLIAHQELLMGYDIIVHTHQNVYMVQGHLILNLLQHFYSQKEIIVVSEVYAGAFVNKSPQLVYATDFFMFKPAEIFWRLFSDYKTMDSEMIAEEFLKFVLVKNGVPRLIAKRFYARYFHRELDYLGLWHEHDKLRVQNYLNNPEESSLFEFEFKLKEEESRRS